MFLRLLILLPAVALFACATTGDSTQTVERPVTRLVSDADTLRAQGRFDLAVPLYNEALRREPGKVDAVAGLRAIDEAMRAYRTDYNRGCNVH